MGHPGSVPNPHGGGTLGREPRATRVAIEAQTDSRRRGNAPASTTPSIAGSAGGRTGLVANSLQASRTPCGDDIPLSLC